MRLHVHSDRAEDCLLSQACTVCFHLGREDMDSLVCSGMEIGALDRPLGHLKALHQYSCLCFVQSLLLYSKRVRRRERYAVKRWCYVLRPHACASCVQAVGAECRFTAVTRLMYSVCRLELPALRGQRSRSCEAVALLGCGVAHSMVERLCISVCGFLSHMWTWD